jgi:hypothetical protein
VLRSQTTRFDYPIVYDKRQESEHDKESGSGTTRHVSTPEKRNDTLYTIVGKGECIIVTVS